jgi:hypothetical protein
MKMAAHMHREEGGIDLIVVLDFLVQPPNLPQYSPREALHKGTLWPALYFPWRGE